MSAGSLRTIAEAEIRRDAVADRRARVICQHSHATTSVPATSVSTVVSGEQEPGSGTRWRHLLQSAARCRRTGRRHQHRERRCV